MRRLLVTLVPLLLLALVGAAPAAAAKAETGLPDAQVDALLQLQHPGGLNRFVRRVSDPTDPHYRQYATVESLVARYGAKPKAQKRVLAWLTAHGIRGTLSPTHTFVIAKLAPRRAARLLPAAAGATASSLGAGPVARQVPAGLRGAVASISVTPAATVEPHDAIGPAPGVEAEGGKKGSGPYGSVLFHTGAASGCDAGRKAQAAPIEPITPNQYLTAYGDTTMHARGLKGEGQSVALVEQGGFKRSDISTYARCFGVKSIPPISAQVVGGAKHPIGEAETTLDLEQLSVTAPGLDHIYVYEAPESLDAIVLAAGMALGDPQHRPDVMSISLGVCEPQVVGALSWRDALDNIFAVAGGAGISVLVSSGDQGSSGCRGQNTETEATTALPIQAVSLPSSDPFVTAVGGTNLSLTKGNKIHEEIVWNDSTIGGFPGIPWGGGGGVSIISPRTPWWQAKVHGFGPGRKVPDLAALADRYPGYAFYCTAASCFTGTELFPGWEAVGGTSAATPLTAAGIALVNQAAEERGQPTLGFLNPLLYGLGADPQTRGAAFTDVTIGDDNVSRALDKTVIPNLPVACCQAGPGYDWVSGWGSLKIPAFSKLALAAWHPGR